MELSYRLERLAADGRRLLDIAARAPDAEVPACPGWTVDDLRSHVVSVWTAIAVHVERLSPEPIPWSELPAREPQEALERLVDVLGTADPSASVWTWSSDHTVGFYLRRAHQETLVHRVDAEQAIGERTPVPAADGIDGVDELFTVMLAGRADGLPKGSLHLHQTDGDGEFMLEVVDGALRVRREHAKGDAALRAGGEDLLLCLWGRRDLEGLELFGDADVAAQWMALSP